MSEIAIFFLIFGNVEPTVEWYWQGNRRITAWAMARPTTRFKIGFSWKHWNITCLLKFYFKHIKTLKYYVFVEILLQTYQNTEPPPMCSPHVLLSVCLSFYVSIPSIRLSFSFFRLFVFLPHFLYLSSSRIRTPDEWRMWTGEVPGHVADSEGWDENCSAGRHTLAAGTNPNRFQLFKLFCTVQDTHSS
jgi:hypothetical protein